MDEKAQRHNEQDSLLSENNKSKSIQTLLGMMLALLWVLTMVVSAASVQLLQRQIPDFELNMFRCAAPFLCCCVGTIFTRRWPFLPKSEFLCTLLYSSLRIIGALTQYVAVTFVPISLVQCIIITSGVTSGIILFAVFGTEKVTLKNTLCSLLCICGVIFMLQPDVIFHPLSSSSAIQLQLFSNETVGGTSMPNDSHNLFDNQSDQTDEKESDAEMKTQSRNTLQQVFGYILSIVLGIMMSLVVIVLKRNEFLTQNKVTVLFWSFSVGTIVSAVIMAACENPVLPSNWNQFSFIVAHCLSYVFMWPLYMYAVQFISGNTINMIFCTSVVIMLITQYTVLSSILPGHQNWIEAVGVALVLVGSITGSVVEMCKSKTEDLPKE